MGFLAINLVNYMPYRPIYEVYKMKYGANEANDVWGIAGERYEELLSSYQDRTPAYRREVKNMLLKAVAIYKTIKGKHQDDAFKIMEEGMKAVGEKKHKRIKKLLAGKNRRRLFVILNILEWKYKKNADRGYTHEGLKKDSLLKKMRITVYGCPYRDLCVSEGVPELTQLFCRLMKQYYTNIPQLIYHQEQTFGQDGSLKCCDIYYGLYQALPNDTERKKKEEARKKTREKWKKRFFFV